MARCARHQPASCRRVNLIKLCASRFSSRSEIKADCNLSVGQAHALWKAMERLSAGSVKGSGEHEPASLFDTTDGTDAGSSVPVADLEAVLVAKPLASEVKCKSQMCSCIPPKYRTRITAAITLVLSTVATTLITQWVQKGTDCAKFDVGALPINVGHTCDHTESATMAPGTSCVVRCIDGFRGGTLLQSTLQCSHDGVWTGSPPICDAELCTQGTILDHSPTNCAGKTVGQVCAFECNDGFTINGTRTCGLGGSANQREMSGGNCVCGGGHFSIRHNEESTRCLPLSMTLEAAGFTQDAVGLFTVVLTGRQVPTDLSRGGTFAVPSAASLSLIGRGGDRPQVSVGFSVEGTLSINGLHGSISNVDVAKGGSVVIRNDALTDGSISIMGLTFTPLQSSQTLPSESPVVVRLASVQLSFNVFKSISEGVYSHVVDVSGSRLISYGLVQTTTSSTLEVTLEGDGPFDFSTASVAGGNSLALIGQTTPRPKIVVPIANDESELSLQHVSIDCVTALSVTRTSPPAGILTTWSMPEVTHAATFNVRDVEIRQATAGVFPGHEPGQSTCQDVTGTLDSVDSACFPDPCYSVSCQNGGTCAVGACQCASGWSGTNCEHDRCYEFSCSGHGTCHLVSCSGGDAVCPEPQCTCEGGRFGDRCEEQDLCFEVSCQNGGTCDAGNGQCTCPTTISERAGSWYTGVVTQRGFSGDNCEIECCSSWGITHCGHGGRTLGCHESHDDSFCPCQGNAAPCEDHC
jgi:hypothetical protein